MKDKPSKKKKTERTFEVRSVALPKEVDARLVEWCELNERAMSFAIARAVREFLAREDKPGSK